jgi:hypothetical protein
MNIFKTKIVLLILQKNADEIDFRTDNATDGMAKVTLDNQKPKDDDEDDVPVRRPKSQKKNLSDDEIHAGLRMCYIMVSLEITMGFPNITKRNRFLFLAIFFLTSYPIGITKQFTFN